MSWVILVLAGVLEVVWAVGLKYTNGFTRAVPSALVGASLVASIALLSWSARHLPIGTAYAVWVGIGALGAALGGVVLFREPFSPARMVFLGLLVVALVGLKLTAK
jgi:quaternary ammonium compound-resistance protein SugE